MKLVRKFQEALAFYLSLDILLLLIFSIQLYYSLVYPFLTYGLIAWGNTYATSLKPVVVLQKKAVRIITFSNRDAHSSPLFSQLGLIKLMDLVTTHTALFMFQYHHHLLPKAFDNFFSPISSKHNNTRLASKSTYYVDHVRTNYSKFNLHFSGPSVWNNLDEDLKSSSLHLFRQVMMEKFLSTYVLTLAWHCQFILSLLLFKLKNW